MHEPTQISLPVSPPLRRAGRRTGSALAQGANPAKLRVALLPDENAVDHHPERAAAEEAYLERTLKKDIELVVTTDYSSMIEAMRFGRIEIAYFGPFSYVLAKSKAPDIEPFAVGVERGSPTYKSIIVAQADGPVKAIADIRGKTFGFGDQASTSSHLIPRAYLLKQRARSATRTTRSCISAPTTRWRARCRTGQVPAGALSQGDLRDAGRAQGHDRWRQAQGRRRPTRSDPELSDGDAGQPRARAQGRDPQGASSS